MTDRLVVRFNVPQSEGLLSFVFAIVIFSEKQFQGKMQLSLISKFCIGGVWNWIENENQGNTLEEVDDAEVLLPGDDRPAGCGTCPDGLHRGAEHRSSGGAQGTLRGRSVETVGAVWASEDCSSKLFQVTGATPFAERCALTA